MILFNTSCAFTLDALTLFTISSANADGFSSLTEKKTEVECLSDVKKLIDEKEKELLYKVEA